MIENILNFIITIAKCNSENDASTIKMPSGKWALPIAITVAGAKAVQHLPAKERLPGLTLVLGFASANAATISAASCLKKMEETRVLAEPFSPRGGPFAPSPFEKIYDVFNNMDNMSSLEQLKYVIELIDAIALFGIFALFMYFIMIMLSNEKIFNFLINNFPFPRYRLLFENFLKYRKISGFFWACLIIVGIMSLFWDIHVLSNALLKVLESSH